MEKQIERMIAATLAALEIESAIADTLAALESQSEIASAIDECLAESSEVFAAERHTGARILAA
jgi:hypothetical protein